MAQCNELLGGHELRRSTVNRPLSRTGVSGRSGRLVPMVEITEALILRDARRGCGGPPADVLVAGGRVAAITNDRQDAAGIREIDGQGGTLLPGLVDAHVHAVQWAASRRRISLADAGSAAEAVT